MIRRWMTDRNRPFVSVRRRCACFLLNFSISRPLRNEEKKSGSKSSFENQHHVKIKIHLLASLGLRNSKFFVPFPPSQVETYRSHRIWFLGLIIIFCGDQHPRRGFIHASRHLFQFSCACCRCNLGMIMIIIIRNSRTAKGRSVWCTPKTPTTRWYASTLRQLIMKIIFFI